MNGISYLYILICLTYLFTLWANIDVVFVDVI